WFRYSTTTPGTCNDTFGTRAPYSSGTGLGSGTADQPYSYGIASLLPGTKYYYCAIASNSYGTGFGAVMSFTTPSMAPAVTTVNASSLTRTTGLLNGSLTLRDAPPTAWFRYSIASPGTCNDTFGTRAPMAGGSAVGAGSTTVTYSQPI